jgi:phosphatidylserine/phosphatidylglycerophosphate/cardiolipin synthase-like enzyme
MAKHKILFLAANPQGTDRLALDEEARAIREELERSSQRDRFELVTRWAVRPQDLLREIRKLRPAVVHFSGHGGRLGLQVGAGAGPHRDIGGCADHSAVDEDPQDGLFLQGTDGKPQFVTDGAIAETIGAAGSSVRLVVLNACFTEPQASALLTHVSCVVGISGSIRDEAARNFAVGFYGGLGDRQSVEAAYRQGRAAIRLEGLPDSDKLQLRVREGVNASELVMADDEPLRPELRDIGTRARPEPRDIGTKPRSRWRTIALGGLSLALACSALFVVLWLRSDLPEPWMDAIKCPRPTFYASDLKPRLYEEVAKARTRIVVAVHQLTDPEFVAALIDAHDRRHVNVRVLVGEAPANRDGPGLLAKLRSTGIEALHVRSQFGGVLHEKIVIVDDNTLFLQTANLSPLGMKGDDSSNRNVGILVTSRLLVQKFLDGIQIDATIPAVAVEAPTSGGLRITPPLPQPIVPPLEGLDVEGETRVIAMSTPTEYKTIVCQLLKSARSSIDIIIPYVAINNKSPYLLDLLQSVEHARNVARDRDRFRVRFLLYREDDPHYQGIPVVATGTLTQLRDREWPAFSELRFLDRPGKGNYGARMILIDNEVTIVSSMDWFESALENNSEGSLAIASSQVTSQATSIFNSYWSDPHLSRWSPQ